MFSLEIDKNWRLQFVTANLFSGNLKVGQSHYTSDNPDRNATMRMFKPSNSSMGRFLPHKLIALPFTDMKQTQLHNNNYLCIWDLHIDERFLNNFVV